MSTLPDIVKQAWEQRNGPAILTTVDATGVPNSVYVACAGIHGDDRVIVADNYFDKTRHNILKGSQHGCLLFIDTDKKAYQIKGRLEYHQDGPLFEAMKAINPPQHPGHAAAVLVVESVWHGANRLEE